MCKDCACENQEELQYESSVDPAMVKNNNVVTISSIKGQ
jgi:hypothetical protein